MYLISGIGIIYVNVENISESDETVETGDDIVNNSNNSNKNKLANCKFTNSHTYYTLVNSHNQLPLMLPNKFMFLVISYLIHVLYLIFTLSVLMVFVLFVIVSYE